MLRSIQLVAITAFLASNFAVAGQQDEAGRASSADPFRPAARAVRSTHPAVFRADTLQPSLRSHSAIGAYPELAEVVRSRDSETPKRPSDFLSELSRRRKSNALIEVELAVEATSEIRLLTPVIEDLWRAGRFEEALDWLRVIESAGHVVGTGISWREPEAAEALAGVDVRIGGTNTGAEGVALDYSLPLDNLFAVVSWGSTVGWSLNLSANSGATWSETFFWCCNSMTVDLTVVADFAYVGYVSGDSPSQARLRRHFATDGTPDHGYSFQTVFDGSPQVIREIALASNAHHNDDRIYYTVLLSDDSVEWFWDVASDGTSFGSFPPGVSNAARGLDMAFNINFASTGLYLSYVDNNDAIYVQRLLPPGTWDGGTAVATGQTEADRTSISAHRDGALVAYQYQATNGLGVEYRITYDEGNSWSVGRFGPAAGEGSYFDPLVTARSGFGTAMIYEQETGAVDTVLFTKRDGYAPGAWEPADPVNDHDFLTGAGHGFGFDWLGVGFGVAYIRSDGAVFFDWALFAPVFSDGFESGDTSAWSSSVP